MKIVVRTFAGARRTAGSDRLELELPPGATVADLRREIASRFASLAPLLALSRIAVDEEFAGDDLRLTPESDVALIPPLSGG